MLKYKTRPQIPTNLCRGKVVKLMAKGSRKIGRDAGTGKFIPVKEAERMKKTATVETIKKK
jgi:hypothetical protein